MFRLPCVYHHLKDLYLQVHQEGTRIKFGFEILEVDFGRGEFILLQSKAGGEEGRVCVKVWRLK